MAHSRKGGLYGSPSKRHLRVCAIYSETTVELTFCSVCGGAALQDVFAAGPPRQPFSRLSMSRCSSGYDPFHTSDQSRPVTEFCRHVRDRRPKSFLLEQARSVVRSHKNLTSCMTMDYGLWTNTNINYINRCDKCCFTSRQGRN